MSRLNRREFVILGGAAVCAHLAGCAGGPDRSPEWTGPTQFDIGAPTEFKAGVDSRWAQSGGFFVVREGDRLYTVSSICTHKACPLSAKGSGEILCPCHGSRFSGQGQVVTGPATTSLPRFGVTIGADGRIKVDRTKTYDPARWSEPGAWVKA
jgi:menaquinol-cytochrome c reductase iron-sulfur subunit